ncbi:ribosomal protein S21 [Lysinibacillus boronitolerans]|uniref:ribosomal protein S21 n=1 Tax=Lysinibacillus boronitolerans TaxID=309788 RepID=UPI0002FBF229|nr:ribosomal protein S21 [Lysinibacillus boronitolerans]
MKISRTDLYNKIWAIGISKTAIELRVPYNKLKSACIKHNIPLPTQSYWGRLHIGKEIPTKTPLPNSENDTVIYIDTVRNAIVKDIKSTATAEKTISKHTTTKIIDNNCTAPTYFDYFSAEEQTILLNAYNSLKMTKSLSAKPHKEIIKYKSLIKNRGKFYNRQSFKALIQSGADDIFPGALIFIDSLFKALEKANATIVVNGNETNVHYKHYLFTLRFRAPSTKITLTPDDKEYESYRTFKYVVKGILSIEIERHERWHPNYPLTTTVTQRANEPFDELLKRLFNKIFSLAPIDDEARRLRLIEEAEEQKRMEEKARIKEIHAQELSKTESLIENSLNYFLYRIVKDYITTELEVNSETYTWATSKANWIKNSIEQPDPILNEEDKAKLIKLFLNGVQK